MSLLSCQFDSADDCDGVGLDNIGIPLPCPTKAWRESIYPKMPVYKLTSRDLQSLDPQKSALGFPFPAVPKPVDRRHSNVMPKLSITLEDMSSPYLGSPPIRFRDPFQKKKPLFIDPFYPQSALISPNHSSPKGSLPSISLQDTDQFLRLFENEKLNPIRKGGFPAVPSKDPPIPEPPLRTGNSSPLTSYTPSVISTEDENHEVYRAEIVKPSDDEVSIVEVKANGEEFLYPTYDKVPDHRRYLSPKEIIFQRSIFISIILILNLGMAFAAFLGNQGTLVLVFMVLVKSKDVLSCIIQAVGLPYRAIKRRIYGEAPIESRVILSLIPAYSESEEQIVKTIFSLRDNGTQPHWQVMCVILDGKPRDIKKHMTRHIASFTRKFETIKSTIGELNIVAGFMEDVPVIVLEKVKNAGKKDSLVLCHDLFNYPRDNMPEHSKVLRQELWTTIIPQLVEGRKFTQFDYIFCTDADSTIHSGALASLTNALIREPKAIAACGLVLVELETGYEWSWWNLYQQFQYCYGQFVRRGAEGIVGKVTCLPGCITMMAVRPEMAGAMVKYAAPVTRREVIHHQVQYLGTDRRLTYSMLSQDLGLKTLFVPEAVSETVAPQSLKHYLSQRRRWGSNAYFNNYFYCFGKKMILYTRFMAFLEVLRLSMVYYRIINTAMFIHGMVVSFELLAILPLIIVAQLPLIWFIFYTLFLNKMLRQRSHKLLLGWLINKLMSFFISITVFSLVARNLGLQVWGMSGVTATGSTVPTTLVNATVMGNAKEELTAADSFEEADRLERMDTRTKPRSGDIL